MKDVAVDTHLERAQHHIKVAKALHETIQLDWAAVCYFYAAYHLIRYSLRMDPVFQDPDALRLIHPELTPQVRRIGRHHGRAKGAGGRQWGINEAVGFLYPTVSGTYEKLHVVSIDVRYKTGLNGLSLNRVSEWSEQVWSAHEAGKLRADAIDRSGPR